jgi:periplasmic copper chaperone A
MTRFFPWWGDAPARAASARGPRAASARGPRAASARALGAAALLLAVLAPESALAASPITVSAPWFRYLLPEIPAGGYMTLHNASDQPAVLIAAASPACGMLMLHKTEGSGGMETMVAVPSVTVPANGSFRFAPDGYHLMCMQPKMKPGDSVPVTLSFADSTKLTVSFPVRNAKGQ